MWLEILRDLRKTNTKGAFMLAARHGATRHISAIANSASFWCWPFRLASRRRGEFMNRGDAARHFPKIYCLFMFGVYTGVTAAGRGEFMNRQRHEAAQLYKNCCTIVLYTRNSVPPAIHKIRRAAPRRQYKQSTPKGSTIVELCRTASMNDTPIV